MDAITSISLIINGILFGCVVIMYRGVKTLDSEIRVIKLFSSALLEFAEVQTGLSNQVLHGKFNKFLDQKAKEKSNG